MTLEKWMTGESLMSSSPRLYMQAVQREVGNGLAGFLCIPRRWGIRLKPVACLEAPAPHRGGGRRVAWAREGVIGVLNSIVGEWLRVAFIDGLRDGTIPR